MRRKWNQRTLWVLPLVAFVVLAALPAQPAGAQNIGIGGGGDIATMAIHGGSVSFVPRVSFEEMTLTVAGRGHVSKQSFRGGQTASFAPVDSKGFQLPDGTYKWELTVSPRAQDLNPRAFKNAKVSADGRSVEAAVAPAGQRQSGVFTIKNGALVDPSLIEVQSGRAVGGFQLGEAPSAAARSAEHSDQDGN